MFHIFYLAEYSTVSTFFETLRYKNEMWQGDGYK